ncbi:obg-like ATPase 1 [Aphelenchoides avenae]|nr:obg-like ATPase 1 [Aphelenchus avenae]
MLPHPIGSGLHERNGKGNEREVPFNQHGEPCVGFVDTRPRLLHPIGSDLRIGIIGLSNAGKTTLFNLLTGSDAAVSPNVFTTQHVMARRTKVSDDRFEWLAKQFPAATLRPSSITLVDTPALLDPFDIAPWTNDVYEALRDCDIVYLVIRAFNDSSVAQWESNACEICHRRYYYGDSYERTPGWRHEEAYRAVNRIMRTRDKRVLAKLRMNATDGDDMDTIATIEDNVRGYTDHYDSRLGEVTTDERVRYHDWTEKELAVLERIRLFTAKPIVYAVNMDVEDFANASKIKSFLDARTFIEKNDKDALVMPFAGHVLRDEVKASLFDASELSGAHDLLQKTIEDCQVGHFYTTNEDMVAAWAVKRGTTAGEAMKLVDTTLESHVTVVEAVSMRGVVEAGSVEKALSLGMIRRLSFEDIVEDGDLLLLTPGRLEAVAKEITDSMLISASALGSTRLSAPVGEEGNCTASSNNVLLAIIFLLIVGLLASLFSNRDLVKRIRTSIGEYRRKREALLGAVRFHADSDSIGFGSA